MLNMISPLDGRYHKQTQNLRLIFSESALMRYRLMVEVEYLIALSNELKIKEVKKFRKEIVSSTTYKTLMRVKREL